MKTFSWKYTQFSQFNSTDTLLLVSGVHFGTPHSTSGEIAVFRVARKFESLNKKEKICMIRLLKIDWYLCIYFLIVSFIIAGFQLQCRVANKPYDIFGTWYSEHYLLSGNLHWLAHLVSTSVLWLNKANQESASEHVPIMTQLFRYANLNVVYLLTLIIVKKKFFKCRNK